MRIIIYYAEYVAGVPESLTALTICWFGSLQCAMAPSGLPTGDYIHNDVHCVQVQYWQCPSAPGMAHGRRKLRWLQRNCAENT